MSLLLALLLAVPLAAAAAGPDPAAGLTIGHLEATHSNGTVYRFPQILGDSLAASRINTFLQTRELETFPGHYETSPFEAVWPGDSSHGMTSVDYTLAFHQPGILAVSITSWHYGAYESQGGGNHYFDARTGELILPRDLLTQAGYAKLDAEITQKRLQRLDDFLAGKTVGDAKLRDDSEEAEEQKTLYRECRTFIEEGHPLAADALTLTDQSLRLVREPCAPHALMALDELGFVDIRAFEQVQELLSDYGRCLLIERRTSCQRRYDALHPGVYRGTIGDRYPITLVVEGAAAGGGTVRAAYVYDEQGKAIRLRGVSTAAGGVQLDEKGTPPARFALRVQPDGRLLGEWTQEGKAPLKVELR